MARPSLRRAARTARNKLFRHSEIAAAPGVHGLESERAPKTTTSSDGSSSSTLQNSPERRGSDEVPRIPAEDQNQSRTTQGLSMMEPNNQATIPPPRTSDPSYQEPSSAQGMFSFTPRSFISDGWKIDAAYQRGTMSQDPSYLDSNNPTMSAANVPRRSTSSTLSKASMGDSPSFFGDGQGSELHLEGTASQRSHHQDPNNEIIIPENNREDNTRVSPTAPATASANDLNPSSFAESPPLPASDWSFTPVSSSENPHAPLLENSSENESSIPSIIIKEPTPPRADGPVDTPPLEPSANSPHSPSILVNSAKATPLPSSAANSTAFSSTSSSTLTPAPTSSANPQASPKNVDFAEPSSLLHKVRRFSQALPASSIRNAPEHDRTSVSESKTENLNGILKLQPQGMQAQANADPPEVYLVILSTVRAKHVGHWDQILHRIQGVYESEKDADNKVISMVGIL
jgi:hypothetical protein